MALPVSHCMGSEVSVSDPGGGGERGRRGVDSCDMWVCWLRGSGAQCATGPRASGFDDSTEGIRIGVDGTFKGADIDEDVPSVPAAPQEALLGQSFLGQRILCGHGGLGCGHDTEVCPLPGGEGEAVGTASALLRLTDCGTTRSPASFGGRALSPLWGD